MQQTGTIRRHGSLRRDSESVKTMVDCATRKARCPTYTTLDHHVLRVLKRRHGNAPLPQRCSTATPHTNTHSRTHTRTQRGDNSPGASQTRVRLRKWRTLAVLWVARKLHSAINTKWTCTTRSTACKQIAHCYQRKMDPVAAFLPYAEQTASKLHTAINTKWTHSGVCTTRSTDCKQIAHCYQRNMDQQWRMYAKTATLTTGDSLIVQIERCDSHAPAHPARGGRGWRESRVRVCR
jgi:hypothetical protein